MSSTKRQEYRRKNLIYGAILLLLMGGVYVYRNYLTPNTPPTEQQENQNTVRFSGKTMGTVPYNVTYIDPQRRNFKAQFDSLLRQFNQSLSTYIPDSEISRFNNQKDTLYFDLPYFRPVLQASREVWQATKGAFDPTVLPLVNAWGFGPDKKKSPSEAELDSIRELVNFPAVQFDEEKVWKTDSRIQLDFSAIAKGQAVDVLGRFLEAQKIENYLVEVGGEVRCRGRNGSNEVWTIGIEDPVKVSEGKIVPLARVKLQNRSMATSGNYRNFYVKDGKRYVHTISPQTGNPIEHRLLSVSVLAPTCMKADAYATAFMVLGREKAQEIVAADPDLEAFFIYDEEGELATAQSAGMEKIAEPIQ